MNDHVHPLFRDILNSFVPVRTAAPATTNRPALGDPRSSYPTPTNEGFYWAKWRIAEDDTHEGEDLTPSETWEVVEVWENHTDASAPEYLKVHVPGVRECQSIENFVWGPEVKRAFATYANTFCSSCGREFGPGEHGFSHCDQHEGKASR